MSKLFQRLSQSAVLIMFIAMSFIPAGDTAGKILSAGLGASPIFVAWSRFFIGGLMLLPFLPRGTWALLRDWRIWLRASLLAVGLSCIQVALSREPIADVFAAFFIGPLVSYVLAIIFLREPIRWQGAALVALGFVGVLIVVQPGSDVGSGLFWAVAAGTCYGAFLTASRWLSHVGTPMGLAFTQLFIAALVLTPFGASNIPTITGQVAWLTLLSALFSMLGNLILLYAYKLAPATRLAPLVYFQLIAAVIFGFVFFNTLPTLFTWIGLLIVMGAGIASARLRA
jgi:drug/metabolite transporter (DMT)-like permease